MTGPALSVVIPIFNEAAIIPELHQRLRATLAKTGLATEIVFVDDGSTDASALLLERLAAADPGVRVVHLSRNFGLYLAVSAGLDHAGGALVALMDGDLQDAPEALPQLIAKAGEGYEVVYAIRTKRKESALKRAVVYLFYRVVNSISSTPLPVDSGLFSVMSRDVVEALKALPERSRYLSGLRTWVGFRQCGIPIERAARRAGAPRQTLRKLSRMAIDGMLTFSYVPLRLATYAGLLTSVLAVVGMLIAVWLRFVSSHPPAGWASIILVMLFIGSVQLLALGILGEYLGRIYDEVKGRPLYVVRRRVGFGQAVNHEEDRDGDARSHADRLGRSVIAA
jgi:dolichol-phosphate mannosyltransferase